MRLLAMFGMAEIGLLALPKPHLYGGEIIALAETRLIGAK